ncbi:MULTISPECIES: phosphodiester glycosidase family protein [unclassified Roseovarius]|uniref:phosphodiester glycosidase family protein n=1 Tax=unclassified Roseovarius TaxID=2614913 RepID=UPI00273D7D6D|nr:MULTISPECIES: phosphodiester glycosidase family protein [unclassified Roseovarius]
MRAFWGIAAFLAATPAWAVDCRDLSFKGEVYTVCEVDAQAEDLRLFLNDPETGKPLGNFTSIENLVEEEGQVLAFSMNAGMYHTDRRPVGHYAEKGEVLAPVITNAGPGNFGLLPNGVFCIREGRADVFETLRYVDEAPDCTYASQSGPMLVIDGALHPRFLPDSDSTYIRNGVGTTAGGETAFFAISKSPVTFHQFGTMFRDGLKLPQALYFDGSISRLYAPDLNRFDIGFPMGPMVGVVAPPPE